MSRCTMMKTATHTCWLAAMGLVMVTSVIPGIHAQLNYSCDPTGVITVVNPDPSTYIYAEANTSDTICTVTFNNSLQHIVLTGCDKAADITMVLSDEATLPVLFTKRLQFHAIKCESIPAQGITRAVLDDSFVTNIVSTSIAPTVTPLIELESGMADESGADVPSAVIGEAVKWDIVGPVGYILMPLSCQAFSGTNATTSLYTIDIVKDGCSLDTNLLSDFQWESPTQKHIVYAMLYAFKFPDSNEVTIKCFVKGCPTGSTMCDFSCPAKRRKRWIDSVVRRRRSVPEPRDQPGYGVVPRDDRRGRVKITMRVIGDPDPDFIKRYFGFFVSGQRTTSPSLLLAVMSALICLLVTA